MCSHGSFGPPSGRPLLVHFFWPFPPPSLSIFSCVCSLAARERRSFNDAGTCCPPQNVNGDGPPSGRWCKAVRGCAGSTRLDSREFFSTRVLSVCESERAD